MYMQPRHTTTWSLFPMATAAEQSQICQKRWENKLIEHDSATDLAPMVPYVNCISKDYIAKAKERKAKTWICRGFSNSARNDAAKLQHWEKEDGERGDYHFARFNKELKDFVRYTEQEYKQHFEDKDWTKAETDQLFDLCERYDLRFVVIADRYASLKPEKPRTTEKIKERYYKIAKKLTEVRAVKAGNPVPSTHPLIKFAYDAAVEQDRKKAYETLYQRPKEKDFEELDLLEEAKRLYQMKRRERVRQRALKGPRKDEDIPRKGAVLVSSKCKDPPSSKMGKRVDAVMEEKTGGLRPRMATTGVIQQWSQMRQKVHSMFEVEKQIGRKEQEIENLNLRIQQAKEQKERAPLAAQEGTKKRKNHPSTPGADSNKRRKA